MSISASARMYHRRRSSGLCVICKTPSGAEVHCDGCRQAHSERHRETYALKRAAGICARCKSDAVPGKALCPRHARVEAERQRERNRRAAVAAGRMYRPNHTSVQIRRTDMLSFKVSREDSDLIRKIVDRALPLMRSAKIKDTRQDVTMDVTAVHANGCPLRLQELLDADDANFGHDVLGIRRYLDRTTGKLLEHFLPRFAAPQGKAA